LAILLAVVLLGVGSPVSKLVTAPPLIAATIRLWLGFPLAWATAQLAGGKLTVSALRTTAFPGLFFGGSIVCGFAAVQHSSVAVVAVILCLQPGRCGRRRREVAR
jgi:hypothetical protein